MAYITIQINCPNRSLGDLNAQVEGSSKPHEGVNKLINLLNSINGGASSGDVQVVVNTVQQTVVAGGGGSSADYNLL